jgi:glycosyltransferase involved in cell wall biosynthesis
VAMTRLQILVVSDFYPWPENTGGRLRLAGVMRALAGVGSVDVFAVSNRQVGVAPPPEIVRFGVGPRTVSVAGRARTLWSLLAGDLPSELGARDYSAARAAFRSWARPRYDLAWLRGAESYVAIGDIVDAPIVVDLDDLEDHKLTSRLAVSRHDVDGIPARGPARGAVRWVKDGRAELRIRVDRRRWSALQHRIAREVAGVAVCSDVDRERLAVRNAVVVPNGYPSPARPVGHVAVREPPRIVFPGFFSYPPNLDAARYLVTDVLPRLRARIPLVEVRLVGRHDHRLEPLSREPGVIVTGQVPEMLPELAQADLVVVPIRFGSGTRIKILEAFAHRIPVVSTSLGCEGLGLVDHRHLLVADEAESFAAACAELLGDAGLRRALTGAAHAVYWERYRWEVIVPRIVDVARSVSVGVAARGRTTAELS